MTIEEINAAPIGSIFVTTGPIYNEVVSYQAYEDENENFPIGSRFIKKDGYSNYTSGFSCKLIIDNKEIDTLGGNSYTIGTQYFAHLALESSFDLVISDDSATVY